MKLFILVFSFLVLVSCGNKSHTNYTQPQQQVCLETTVVRDYVWTYYGWSYQEKVVCSRYGYR